MSIGSNPYPYNYQNNNGKEPFGANPALDQAKGNVTDKARNTGIGKLATGDEEDKDSTVKKVAYGAVGIAACVGIEKGINKLNANKLDANKNIGDVVQISNGELKYLDKSYEQTTHWKYTEKVDNFVKGNKFLSSFENFVNTKIITPGNTKLKSLYNNNPNIKLMVDRFKGGIEGDRRVNIGNGWQDVKGNAVLEKQFGKQTKGAGLALQQSAVQEFNGNALEAIKDSISNNLKKGFETEKHGLKVVDVLPAKKPLLSSGITKEFQGKEADAVKKLLEDIGKASEPAALKSGNVINHVCELVNKSGIQDKALKGEITKIVGETINKSNISHFGNKVQILEALKNKSFISKVFAKAPYVFERALTVSGKGKMAMVMLAVNGFFIGSSLREASKAPKGEKLSVFMEDFLGNQIGGFLLMPFVGKMIFGTRGLGLNKLKEFKGPLGKLAGGIAGLVGKFARIGVDTRTYATVKNAKGLSKLPAFLQWGANKFSKAGGGTLRFGIALFALLPIFTKAFTGVSHAIFGTPTKTKMEEEKAKAEKAQKQSGKTAAQPDQNTEAPQEVQPSQPVNPAMYEAPVNNAYNQLKNDSNLAPKQIVKPNGDNYSYIPSAQAANINNTSSDQVTSALNKSQKMEEYANNMLKTYGR